MISGIKHKSSLIFKRFVLYYMSIGNKNIKVPYSLKINLFTPSPRGVN
jgi:hypothetical protein